MVPDGVTEVPRGGNRDPSTTDYDDGWICTSILEPKVAQRLFKWFPKWIQNRKKIDQKRDEEINIDFWRLGIRFSLIFEAKMKPNCDKNWK